MLGMITTGFAQSDKVKEKAMEKTEELNEQIVAGDASLALSKEQMQQIQEIHIKRIMESRELRKADADQQEIKAVNKKYFQQIYKEVLSKEQMKARRAGKKDMDEDEG